MDRLKKEEEEEIKPKQAIFLFYHRKENLIYLSYSIFLLFLILYSFTKLFCLRIECKELRNEIL